MENIWRNVKRNEQLPVTRNDSEWIQINRGWNLGSAASACKPYIILAGSCLLPEGLNLSSHKIESAQNPIAYSQRKAEDLEMLHRSYTIAHIAYSLRYCHSTVLFGCGYDAIWKCPCLLTESGQCIIAICLKIFIEHCDVKLEITNISEFTHMSGRPRCMAQAPGRSGCEASGSVPSQRQCGEVTMEPGWGYGEATGPRYSLSCLALPRQCTVRCTLLSARPTFIFSLQQWQCLNQHKYYILVCVKLYKCMYF